jgi:SAM-dependent methyltransferase
MNLSAFLRAWGRRFSKQSRQLAASTEEWRSVAHTWEALARNDPLWAVLSEPDKRGRKWDLQAFLATGEEFIDTVLGRATSVGIRPGHGLAVDFGCGVGRLSRALSYRFDKVIGIDVSETMVRIAGELNEDRPNLSFVLNERDDLRCLSSASVDVACSHITLQHMKPALAERYIGELFRITRPGGLVFFQVPDHRFLAEDARTSLSAEDCRAELAVRSAPEVLAPGTVGDVIVQVRNASAADWRVPLNVGNHWRDRGGQIVTFDDGRSSIPALNSGDSAEISLTIAAPTQTGLYRLEVDVVQEGVRWFADVGSPTASVSISVDAGGRQSNARLPHAIASNIDPVYVAATPPFEMHGVPRRRVEEIASTCGMRLLHCDDYRSDWQSYEYYFEKQRQFDR